MSDVDLVSQDLSVDDGLNGERFVPVSESIRYRKRAQVAEKQLAEFDGQLRESNERNQSLVSELEEMKVDRKLAGSLISAGVSDLETALLVAKKRLASCEGEGANAESIVESLKLEKGYLFGRTESLVGSVRTSPARDRAIGGRGVLEKTAGEAARSGSRRDVQEYMRVRRQFV